MPGCLVLCVVRLALRAGISASWWLDSGIRFGVTEIEALQVVGIDMVTTGQIPNTEAGLSFEYFGTLADQKHISFVEATLNENFPCASATASQAVTASSAASVCYSVSSDASTTACDANADSTFGEACSLNAACDQSSSLVNKGCGTTGSCVKLNALYSGMKTAASSSKKVTTMDTQKLGTPYTFALCYATNNGAANDNTYSDSGIRVTVPKVWNTLMDSGYTGPACDISS